MPRVASLEALNDAESVEIVIKTQAIALKAIIQRAFAGMAKRRMTNVVDEGQRLREIDIEAECRSYMARDLCDFDCVGQAAAKMIRSATCKHLGLACESAKCPRLYDAIAVTLEGSTVIARGRWKVAHR